MANEMPPVVAVLRANISDYMKKMQAARGEAKGFGADTKSSMRGIGVAAGAAFGAIAAGATAVIGLGLKVASDMEQARIGFTTMLGSAEKADAFLRDLADFAAKTPFELPDLVAASQRMKAMGFAAEQIMPTLTAVGDAVAAMGGSKEHIDRVTLALGQMQAKGKVSGEELRQLTEAGIPVWDILAKKIGVTVPEAMQLVEKRAVDANVFIAGFIENTSQRVGGMMQKQSQTLLGMLSTLKDTIKMKLADAASPLVDSFKKAMPVVTDVVGRLIDKVGPVLADVVGSLLRAVQGLLPILEPLISVFGTFIKDVVDVLLPVLKEMAPEFAKLATALGDLLTALLPLLPALLEAAVDLLPLLTMMTQFAALMVDKMMPVLKVAVPIFVALWATFKIKGLIESAIGSLGGFITKLTTTSTAAGTATMSMKTMGAQMGLMGIAMVGAGVAMHYFNKAAEENAKAQGYINAANEKQTAFVKDKLIPAVKAGKMSYEWLNKELVLAKKYGNDAAVALLDAAIAANFARAAIGAAEERAADKEEISIKTGKNKPKYLPKTPKTPKGGGGSGVDMSKLGSSGAGLETLNEKASKELQKLETKIATFNDWQRRWKEAVEGGIKKVDVVSNLARNRSVVAADVTSYYQREIGRAREFAKLLTGLARKGLNRGLLMRLASEGPDALEFAQVLNQMDVGYINRSEQAIQDLASGTANAITGTVMGSKAAAEKQFMRDVNINVAGSVIQEKMLAEKIREVLIQFKRQNLDAGLT